MTISRITNKDMRSNAGVLIVALISIVFALLAAWNVAAGDSEPGAIQHCGEFERCAGTTPPLKHDSLTAARASNRTRGSNSQLIMPGSGRGVYLADVDGDGRADFVSFKDRDLSAVTTDYEQLPIWSHTHSDAPIKNLLIGDFHGTGVAQTCIVGTDNLLYCYETSPDRRELWWWFSQPIIAGADEDMIVGDYDGNGRDDVLVYHGWGEPFRMYTLSDKGFGLVPMLNFKQGHLQEVLNTRRQQIRVGDFNGDGRDDLLIGLRRYDSVYDGTANTFWLTLKICNVVGPYDNVTVARIDDDTVDDVVIHNSRTGTFRFYRLESPDCYLHDITSVDVGQLAERGNRVYWGSMHGSLDEPGASNRDDALVWVESDSMYMRSDARWNGSRYTYWWAWTQTIPATGLPPTPTSVPTNTPPAPTPTPPFKVFGPFIKGGG